MADKYVIGEGQRRQLQETYEITRSLSPKRGKRELLRPPARPPVDRGGLLLFRARITGHSTSTRAHSWTRLTNVITRDTITTGEDWPDVPDSAAKPGSQGTVDTYPAYDVAGRLWPTGSIVTIVAVDDETSEAVRAFEIVAGVYPGQHFAVSLTKDGGVDGNKTTAPSYTYTAKSIDADATVTYGTALTPVCPRRFGKFTSGDGQTGVGYYDTTGTFKLWNACEVESPLGCP